MEDCPEYIKDCAEFLFDTFHTPDNILRDIQSERDRKYFDWDRYINDIREDSVKYLAKELKYLVDDGVKLLKKLLTYEDFISEDQEGKYSYFSDCLI